MNINNPNADTSRAFKTQFVRSEVVFLTPKHSCHAFLTPFARSNFSFIKRYSCVGGILHMAASLCR